MLQMLFRMTWNSRGWRIPTANSADGGYPSETGFGHEEWNFQVEDAIDGYVYGYLYYVNPSEDAMQKSGGVFDIGFWAMHPDTREKLLVGAYKAATLVPDDEMKKVYKKFKDLGIIQRRAEELVAVVPNMTLNKAIQEVTDAVRKPYIKWRCPVDKVIVYEQMIELPPVINGKNIGKHFTKPTFVDYTAILPASSTKPRKTAGAKGSEAAGRTTPLAEDAYYRESAANLRIIIPRHNKLSNLFSDWLKNAGVREVHQEKGHVDVSFEHQNKSHLAELKICYGVGTTKAIREAMGQLFEYNYHSGKSPMDVWIIVLDEKPSTADVTFIEEITKTHKLPIHLGWKASEASFAFSDEWQP